MPDQDDTVQWLRARILALEAERPRTASGALAKYAAIQELERDMAKLESEAA